MPARSSRITEACRFGADGEGMGRLHSISARFISGAVGTAIGTLVCLIGLVAYQLEQSMHRQGAQLESLSEVRLTETLKAGVRLAAARLEFLIEDTGRRILAISQRTDTLSAVASRNVVAMSEMLGPAMRNADVDGIVVLDAEGKVVGASSGEADLILLNAQVAALPFVKHIRELLKDNQPDNPAIFSSLVPATTTAALVPTEHKSLVSHILFVPLFDDFGYVTGGFLAQRWIRESEKLLLDLSRIGSVGLTISHDGNVFSRAGYDGDGGLPQTGNAKTNISPDGRHFQSCGTPIPNLTICAMKPIERLYETQSELTRIGVEEEERMLQALIILGGIAIIIFTGVSVALSRQITRPLSRITRVLSCIADGKYEETVAGTDRKDEVGNIARSVVLLQASMRERDNLRSKVDANNKMLRAQEAELRTQNVLFDAALNNMSHGLCMFDSQQRLIVSNQRYLELFEHTAEQVMPGMSIQELTEMQRVIDLKKDVAGNPVAAAEGDFPSKRRSTVIAKLENGRTIMTTKQPLLDGGWVAISEDVTEREHARDRLAFLASHDSLTMLPNRVRLREHLDAVLGRLKIEGGAFAVLCLDLDEFKTVNDSLGHPIGDELLRQVAKRLLFLTNDQQLVVRLGGDEFAIVTENPSSGAKLEQFAREIIDEISRPYYISDHETVIGVSIGISVTHDGDINGDELFKQADLALYKAKEDGRKTFKFFEEEMGTIVNARRELITDLRNVIENGELEVHFQPQISLQENTISGFEALVRWRHPKRGMISPAEFIPIAEDTGLIVNLGEWIIREACRVAASWPDHIRIAVNLSPRQLKTSGFGAILVNTLATSGLAPERLELEVTESVLLSDNKETLAVLHQAKALGVKVSMDDFGTGYSSLSYLRSFPFDKIKIDQSFVRSMSYCEDSVSIVKAVIELSNSLNMTTTAEGVETEDLIEMLRDIGCTEAQGYYFGRPMPANEAQKLLSREFPIQAIAVNG